MYALNTSAVLLKTVLKKKKKKVKESIKALQPSLWKVIQANLIVEYFICDDFKAQSWFKKKKDIFTKCLKVSQKYPTIT